MSIGNEAFELHLSDARCADLVLGLLDEPARNEALSHARACPECEARLRSHAGASERAAADWQSQVASTPIPLRPRRASRLPAWLAAAAAVIAVAALPILLRNRPPGDSAIAWLPLPGEAVRTRGESAPDEHLTAGLEAYAARDLVTAKRELEAAGTVGPAGELRRLYLGHVLVASGSAREGVELMSGVRWTMVPEPWRHDGAIAFARALRAVGDFARADSVERSLEFRSTEKP